VAEVGKNVHKWEINNYIHREKQYTQPYKNTEHTKQKTKHTKQEDKHKMNKLKDIKRLIRT
jgi:hypothetical protein